MDTLNLFPTRVFGKRCNLDLETLENSCYEFQKKYPSVQISNVGGYQGRYFKSNELEKEIINSFPRSNDKELTNIEVTQWLNINSKDSHNILHSHGPFFGNALSGVFYVKAPKKCGNINLYDPRGALTSAIDLDYYNNSDRYYWIEPYDNLMLIFPSWLEHSVDPNESEEDRISIAFNIKLDYK